MTNIYKGEYNYFCAMNNWRGSYKDYLIWRTRRAILEFE